MDHAIWLYLWILLTSGVFAGLEVQCEYSFVVRFRAALNKYRVGIIYGAKWNSGTERIKVFCAGK